MATRCRRRSGKQAKRWQRKLERYRAIQRQIEENAPDILKSANFHKTREHIQHGNMTVNGHVMNVARYSLAISDKLHIRCNRRELVRGALLHDYFLYDWHIPDEVNPHRLHGFYHPGRALKNAIKEYELTEREKDIIRLRFFEGRTQTEVAEEISISQAQVSRLEKSALKTIRQYLTL